ncbi:MAG: excinuclease ABC subunit UvrC [Proteobacteria bacterium]|nr:excinuclease ABC subunit UvrC [Pseudomonadota bacterium]
MKPDKKIPDASGVYIMKSASGTILYIGKAKILKKRISSYFDKKHENGRIAKLVAKIKDIDWIITENETDALILENNLIKLHKPYYNIQLKDDKTYPYIKITVKDQFPGMYITRRYYDDGSVYFGPYTKAGAAQRLFNLLKRTFKIRTCNRKMPDRACLDYHINLCFAPCIGKIDEETYNISVKSAVEFLSGDITKSLSRLNGEMKRYISLMQFEKAAVIRDTIKSIQELRDHQHVMLQNDKSADFISLLSDGLNAVAGVFRLRNGAIVGKEIYHISNPLKEDMQTLTTHFILRYVNISFRFPPVIKIKRADNIPLINDSIASLKKNIHVRSLYGSKERAVMRMLEENIRFEIEKEKQHKQFRTSVTVKALKEALDLNFLPEYMACFDISHIYGNYSVGSAVVFHNGKPLKKRYRHFRIKSVEGINDFDMMNEVVSRYLSHKENRKIDLLVVDGGAIQLRKAKEAVKAKRLKIPVIALAKKLEEVYISEKDIISLPKTSPALKLLQQIRDEAHRFAISYNRLLRINDFRFLLEQINGIGKKRAMLLLTTFGSMEKIGKASLKELTAVQGINRKIAKEIKKLI